MNTQLVSHILTCFFPWLKTMLARSTNNMRQLLHHLLDNSSRLPMYRIGAPLDLQEQNLQIRKIEACKLPLRARQSHHRLPTPQPLESTKPTSTGATPRNG